MKDKDDAPELCEASFSKAGAVYRIGGKEVTREQWYKATFPALKEFLKDAPTAGGEQK